jgi:uncharacterized heparinase superfamily protein
MLYKIYQHLHRPKVKTVSENPQWVSLRPKVPFLVYPQFESEEISKGHFSFLNDSAHYSKRIDWQAQGKKRLWRYNLHYFQYLHAAGHLEPTFALSLMQDWVQKNPPGTPDAWDPFPLSLRLVNWMKYATQKRTLSPDGASCIRSAYQQTIWLEQRLERDLLGNHFFKNIKALLFAGFFFQSRDARRWLSKGIHLLQGQLVEQILSDGGHFERSPMYHSMILEDCLDLLNLCANIQHDLVRSLAKQLKQITHRMAHFLAGITHPDGNIALLNDAAFGIEPHPSDLLAYFEHLTGDKILTPKPPYWSFPATGYFVIAPQPLDRLILDCGPLGPDYQPGHGHCDTLSYELSLNGKRLIVDSGVYDYQEGEMRQYVRSTRAHNTIMVDGEEQSEIWGAFRVARRAKPIFAQIDELQAKRIRFSGAHDGYRRLRGDVIHERRVEYDASEGWIVQDRIIGMGKHSVESFINIHPDFKASIQGQEIALLNRKCKKQAARIIVADQHNLKLIRGWYCPEFGLRLENDVIVLSESKELPLEMAYRILPN